MGTPRTSRNPGTRLGITLMLLATTVSAAVAGGSPDVNDDGVVNVDDLLAVVTAWGPCAGCPEDVDGSGTVDVDDLLEVINAWGTITTDILVDFAQSRTRNSMAGFLNGLGGNPQPTDDMVRNLAPKLVRGTWAQLLLSDGPAAGRLDLITELDATYTHMISNMWGYPAFNWQCPWCPGLGHPLEHQAQWQDLVGNQVQAASDLGVIDQVIFDVWNEPSGNWFGFATEAELHEVYRLAAVRIHAMEPTARIAGPSVSGFQPTYIQNFLDACLANGVEVNVLTWHELLHDVANPNPDDPPSEIREIADHL